MASVSGESVTSPVLEVGGYRWKIYFYPDGIETTYHGYASAFVHCYSDTKATDATAKFTLSILEKRSQANVASFDAVKRVFSPRDFQLWGHHYFVDKAKLESLSQLGDGCFTIRCVLTVVTDTDESPPLQLPTVPSQLESMLEEGRGADVTFLVGSQEFRGHRSFLAARSPVLGAQFYGPMAEKDDMPRVKVIDVEPDIFQMMLHYIYKDSLPLPPADDKGGYSVAAMQHLMVAADIYGLERLKLMCEDELCKIMDAATVMSTYALANQHHCKRLKDACVDFMTSKEVLAAILETNERFMTRCRPLPLEEDHEEEEVDHSRKFKRPRTK
ncbi:hypothetical protein VPH35_031561 [Triticum aestivum]